MNKRTIVVIIAVIILSICCLPILVSGTFLAIDSIDNPALSQSFSILFMISLCCAPLALGAGALIWQLHHASRSKVAAQRLAEALNLQPLNESAQAIEMIYGGERLDHRFTVKAYGSTYRYYAQSRRRTGVNYLLQISVEVKVPEPMGVMVQRPRKGASKNPQNFDEAFEVENGERLNDKVKTAMFDFIQKGYPTGLRGTTYRSNKSTRNLRLRDRETAPEGLLADEILADAHVVLIHNHPDTMITAVEFEALLDDMLIIAQAIEDQYYWG